MTAASLNRNRSPWLGRNPLAGVLFTQWLLRTSRRESKARRRRPSAPPPRPSHQGVLAEVVRNVVERVVQRVADAAHRTDGGNGDQGRDQTILDGGRTLLILQHLHELGHVWSPVRRFQRHFSPRAFSARLPGICSVMIEKALKAPVTRRPTAARARHAPREAPWCRRSTPEEAGSGDRGARAQGGAAAD